MKKEQLLFIIFILFSSALFSQEKKWHFGLEPTANIAIFGEQLPLPRGFNGFVKYKKYEFYIGTDIYRIEKIYGLETGLKYHFISNKRLSHFFVDLNFQKNKWCEGSTLPVRYDYEPKYLYDDRAMFRMNTYLLSSTLGYEVNFTKWLSTTIAIGPGVNYYTLKTTWIANYLYCGGMDKNVWKGVILTKVALRITI